MTNKANIFRKKMLCLKFNVKHIGNSDNIDNKHIYIIIEIKMNFKMFIYIFFLEFVKMQVTENVKIHKHTKCRTNKIQKKAKKKL